MSLPKEPRQLMINLMYLVLTALLAMNVSKEVINAFTIVDKSIGRSNTNIESKNLSTMKNFELSRDDDELELEKREKVAKAMEIAEEARKKTSAMVAKLEAYKEAIITGAGGIVPETGKIKREADLESATSYMITQGNGARMKSELEAHKAVMAKFIDSLGADMKLSKDADPFEKNLPINFDIDNSEKSWSENMFEMVPAVAAVTIINKYKNDVMNSESAVLDELWASAMGEKRKQKFVEPPIPIVPDEKFNQYGVIASLDNSYALPGQTLNLTSMLGAFNADSKGLRIWVNGRPVSPKKGIAKMKIRANSKPGKHSIRVRAQYLDKGKSDDAVARWVPVKEEVITYYVGQPQATISLDKMKIFYKGLKNPMTVSASGVRMSDISVTGGPNIKLVKTGLGKYNVLASKNSGKTWVQITGKRSDGSIENFGKIEYRLGRVPDPIAYVADKTGGAMPVNAMKVQQAVFAKLKGFPYDLKYNVTSFNMVHVPKRGEMPAPLAVTGKFLNRGAAKALLNTLKVGDRLFFEDVRAKGPDGETRKLGGLSFYFPN